MFFVKKYDYFPYSSRPSVEDNSGAIQPMDLGVLQDRITEEIDWLWTATDHAGNSQTCTYEIKLAGA
jgi:hypothetical protein